jgi:thiamine biosynthesis protein ThiS
MINGNSYQFTYHVSLYFLLEYLGFQYNLIVVDYNGTILPQEFWPQTFLHENDNIEILTIAGGG